MFGKKQPQPTGRQRPASPTDRRSGAAVFSYNTSSRNTARPGIGNTGRDVYAQQRAQAQGAAAERNAQTTRRASLKRLPVVIAVVLLAGLAVNSLFVGVTPRLEVAETGGKTLLRDPQVYEQAATELMGQTPANRLKLTAKTEYIALEMAKRYPELGTVSLMLPVFGHQPVLRVEPAAPALILGTTGQSYVLDTSGRVLGASTENPAVGKLGLPVVTDQSGFPAANGQIALPSSTTRFITEVVGQLKAAKLPISSLTLPRGASELDVRLEGQPYFVKFNLMGNARAEAGAFLAVKQHLDREKKVPSQYIDVRVEGRAYYK
jgi:hypothetical protein